MDSNVQDNLLVVCRLLEKYKIEYLTVGGTAVAFYGYHRISVSSMGIPSEMPDLDFWYNPTYNNYFNLLKVMGELGYDVSVFIKEKTPNPHKSFFKLNFPTYTIDFLPSLPGLPKFGPSYVKREDVQIEGVSVSFIDFDDLITNKQALLREKDIADISELEKKRKG